MLPCASLKHLPEPTSCASDSPALQTRTLGLSGAEGKAREGLWLTASGPGFRSSPPSPRRRASWLPSPLLRWPRSSQSSFFPSLPWIKSPKPTVDEALDLLRLKLFSTLLILLKSPITYSDHLIPLNSPETKVTAPPPPKKKGERERGEKAPGAETQSKLQTYEAYCRP